MSNVKIGAQMWDERFSSENYAYGKQPNAWLKERISTLDVGTLALFPADGEGRNAVWAAMMGWKSEVFDLSQEGKRKCALLAEENNVEVHYEVDDLELRGFSQQKYDLIACSWFHTPSDIRKEHMPRMLHALRDGGNFIMEGYHKSQMERTSGGPKSLDLLFDEVEVLAELTGDDAPNMEVVFAEHCQTELDESDLHRGLAEVVRIHLVRV